MQHNGRVCQECCGLHDRLADGYYQQIVDAGLFFRKNHCQFSVLELLAIQAELFTRILHDLAFPRSRCLVKEADSLSASSTPVIRLFIVKLWKFHRDRHLYQSEERLRNSWHTDTLSKFSILFTMQYDGAESRVYIAAYRSIYLIVLLTPYIVASVDWASVGCRLSWCTWLTVPTYRTSSLGTTLLNSSR